ncbi:MAG: hypothetical protein HN778_20565 [Prolixibacteraceae bacterium]|jgi:hypothetical protein|nr:hypothetical protein [Prolixibacteraceae bacterium]MBT6763255.1 hypothetical protein [Prolixibacteraceae bacterium]MBT7000314.1 hypothetical protein [Prolixibacteraceae bacterium]MBT7397231.1 hypothetical protein [Prolixibacteraceae bacterium]
MKNSSILKLILFGFLCAFLASSCVKEGPMGPAGANGTDGADGSNGLNGVDGNVSCLVCHSTTNLESKRAEFAMSGHSAGAGAVAYAGGRQSCAKCHGHEGFVQYAEFGEVLGNITSPSAWECSTCHGLHQTFESVDYALRLSDPVVPIFDSETTIDLGGNSNLCANCHQSRRAEPNVTNPGEETFRITSTHYGPHHGAQANVLAGVGFAEIPGSVAYPLPGSAIHLTQASCTGCHMAEFSNGEGGHSFKPNLDACNICHGTEIEDFNYGGVQSNIHAKLEELRDKLIELEVVEWGEDTEFVWNQDSLRHIETPIAGSGSYHPHVGSFPMVQAQAFFNWIGLEEDRSLGAHNPKYINALLINTLEALE